MQCMRACSVAGPLHAELSLSDSRNVTLAIYTISDIACLGLLRVDQNTVERLPFCLSHVCSVVINRTVFPSLT
jgi:hypothetical protein